MVCHAATAQESFFDFFFPEFRDNSPRQQPRQKMERNTVKFIWDSDFQYNFDNREFTAGSNAYTESMTINAARLTPSIGLGINNDNPLNHRVILGVQATHNMGEYVRTDDKALSMQGRTNLELLMYYNINFRTKKTAISGYAGVFPRSMSETRWPDAFLSDSLKFYDSSLEGALVKIRRPHSYYEIGADWMGMIGSGRRERFQIFGSAESYPFTNLGNGINGLSVGGYFSMYHFANTLEYKGVVDNVLIEPYLRYDIGHIAGIQELSITAGYIQAIQRDRIKMDSYATPKGGQIDIQAMNWNVGLRNGLYAGEGLMPLYNNDDAGGNKYGSMLYMGSPFYRSQATASSTMLYDRIEAFYQPNIASFLDLRISMSFHFAGSPDDFAYQGRRQTFSLIFNLDNAMNPRTRAIRNNNAKKKKVTLPKGNTIL